MMSYRSRRAEQLQTALTNTVATTPAEHIIELKLKRNANVIFCPKQAVDPRYFIKLEYKSGLKTEAIIIKMNGHLPTETLTGIVIPAKIYAEALNESKRTPQQRGRPGPPTFEKWSMRLITLERVPGCHASDSRAQYAFSFGSPLNHFITGGFCWGKTKNLRLKFPALPSEQ